MAGMMETSSFSVIGVCRFSRNRMSSSFTKMLTKRLTLTSRKSLVDVFNQLQYKTPTCGNSLCDDPKFQELGRRIGLIEQ